jgi:tetratricopeptide (TPR) repeat protein
VARQSDGAARDGQRGQLLIERAQHTGDLGTFEHAIALLRRALSLTSRGDLDYALYLSNLGVAWHTRFWIRGDIADLDRAIDAMKAALVASQDQACDRATDLSNLCDALRIRFEHHGDEADLAAAVEAGREALRAVPKTDPSRIYYLNSLAGVPR